MSATNPSWVLVDTDPAPGEVEHITFVPFFPDGTCAVVRRDDGTLVLPAGAVGPEEDVRLDAGLRIPLEAAGFRRQTFHAFARRGTHLFAWCEGDVYTGTRPHATVELEVAEVPELVARLRGRGRHDLAALVDAAVTSRRTADPAVLRAEQLSMLESAYLGATTAEGGSGFGGTPLEWRARREPILDGIDHDGTFLDIGCANGLLMESVRSWAGERGLDIEPYGFDISAALVAVARDRLPQWADRLWAADATTWSPSEGVQFHYVHSCIVEFARPEDVERVLGFVRPGGRLLYSRYVRSDVRDRTAAQCLRALGFDVAGESRRPLDRPQEPPTTAWIEVPS